MKHYTQLSREAQEEFDLFESKEKHRADMAVFKLTLICGVILSVVAWGQL